MVKNSSVLKTEMETELKKINLGLRALASLHCSFQKCAEKAAKRLRKELFEEKLSEKCSKEESILIKTVALQLLEDMATEPFETFLRDFSLSENFSLSFDSAVCGFLALEDFFDLSSDAKNLHKASLQMSSAEYKRFSENLKSKFSKEATLIAQKVVSILTSYMGYVFFLKRIVEVDILNSSENFLETQIIFEVDFK